MWRMVAERFLRREVARCASLPSQLASPPQISRSECARLNWQKSIATNWPQHVKPRALFVSKDFGETWSPIAAGLPAMGWINVVKEHPKTAAKAPAAISIRSAAGALVRELEGTLEAGLNRVVWDLRSGAPAALAGQRGPFVPTGAYTVTVRADGSAACSRSSMDQESIKGR